MTKNAL